MHIVRAVAFITLALAGILMPCSKADAQPGVLSAAAQYMQRERAKLPISVDPRLYGGRGLPGADAALHPDSVLAELRGDSLITVLSRERALECSGVVRPECRTHGVGYFVVFSRPAARGDSAFIDVFVRASRTPTAADSARIRATANLPPEGVARALERLSLGGATSASMVLVRTAAAWRVVSFQIRGQS